MPVDSHALARYREKWREAPQGSDLDGRVFSDDLLKLGDEELLAAWERMAARRYTGELAWLGPLYGDTFRSRKVIELGSGLGFDGLRFAADGASWTFCDIVPSNLALIGRIARLKRLEDRTSFHLIGDDLSFAALPHDYDAVWVFGSIHHVPFEIARREALDVLGHLKPGGRWMELVYPRERWLREGAPPFDEWGKLTDGERTPWVEWHDVEKVRRRLFPAPFKVLLDFGFCSDNYRWIDLQYASDRTFEALDRASAPARDLLQGPIHLVPGTRRSPPWSKAWSFVAAPRGLFGAIASVNLGPVTGPAAVDLEIAVSRGAVGVGLVTGEGKQLTTETVVEQGRHSYLVTLRAEEGEQPTKLVFRNFFATGRSRFAVKSAVLRGPGNPREPEV